MSMSKYLAYLRVNLINIYAYRADFFLYMGLNTVFFYISIALWAAVYTSSGAETISSYTLSDMITYSFMTSLLFRLDLTHSLYLGEDIWGGYFANDLIKPWNIVLVHFTCTLSDLFFSVVTYLPFFVIMYLTSFKMINLPTTANLIWFLIIVAASLIMNFFFNLILHALTFHFGDQESQIHLINYITSFLAGAIFPIALLSGWVKELFMALPFKLQFAIPAEAFLGKISPAESLGYAIEAIVWCLIFYLIFHFVYKSGLKKFTGTGR